MKTILIKKDKESGIGSYLTFRLNWKSCALPIFITVSQDYIKIQFLWLSIEYDSLVAPACM